MRKSEVYITVVIYIAAFLLHPSRLFADGGTLRLSQRDGDFQCSVFTSPASLRVGVIDISVLVQDAATGHVRDDVSVVVRLQSVDRPQIVLEQPATAANATNKLFRAALLDVPEPGTWRASILLNGQSPGIGKETGEVGPLAFDISIAPPLPAWLQVAPWISWPFAVLALFILHQMLVFRAS